MSDPEFLVSHGQSGELGRFRSPEAVACRRGDRVVVRGLRGLELGVVLCAANDRHARWLPDPFVGELLRRAGCTDEEASERMSQRGRRLFEDGRRLIAELSLPLELLDVQVPLDGQLAILYHVCWDDCDMGPFIQLLSQRHALRITLHDLTSAEPHAEGGCGKEGCGQGAGGCNSCGSGGCSTGCGSAAQAKDVLTYFADLRRQMEQRSRTPLL